jgi:lipoprotein-anchoring transpeptidase ErfK/SrfK
MRRIAALALVALAAALAGCGGAAEAERQPAGAGDEPAAPRPATTQPARARPLPPPEGPLRRLGGQVLRRVQLRASPGGRPLRTLGRKTGMNGPQILAIVARRGEWYGVLHPTLPNGRAGWVHLDAVKLLREPWEITVDRSARRLDVLRSGRRVDSFPVAVGRPGSPTPLGRFAVTDRLATTKGSPYGCCILALSGRQTRLPPGWPGGDRLALHGTTTGLVGGAYSAGCVRIRDHELQWLMDRIPVGTRVTVRA